MVVDNEKAKLNWAKVRNAVFGANRDPLNRLNLLLLESGNYENHQKKEATIFSHGIKLLKEINIHYIQNKNKVEIKQVICDSFKSYLILFTDGNLCQCNEGTEQETFWCKERILSICFADKFKSYVAVCADNNLRILDRDLNLINAIPYSGFVNGLAYNTFTHEILTYGTGSIIVWLFRTSGTLLIPKLVVTDKILRDDKVIDICIERTSSEEQRCFSVIKIGVLIHKLSSGSCIQMLIGIHDSIITKILYFQPLKLLVTSSKDGCIKSWNEDGSLHCIFIGHSAEITSISFFPFGPKIISTSNDGSLRTWSLESNNETDCHKFNSTVYGVGTQFGIKSFFSFTKDILYLWEVNNLHLPFVVLRTKANSIKTTTNPKVSPISYCICDDACVRVICPVSGNIVTVFIIPDGIAITDAVYHLSENLLIVLLVDGKIMTASTSFNPCSIMHIWDKEATNDCTSISLYEYMPEGSSDDDQWKQINTNDTYGRHMNDSSDKTLLFGGCKDGTIVVFEWMEGKNNGSVIFNLQAHMDEVTDMSSNPKMDQLASTSKDKSLKIWRVFPFAEEALTPLLLFEHSMPIHGIEFSNKSLCVIYQDLVRAYHTIGMYKTSHDVKERCVTQDVMKDHTDVILSITACPRLNLIASSSKDGSVHIRNTENDLISILRLNDIAHSISFCSQRGNLLLAIRTNIHIIKHKQYLPAHILREMVGMKFVECEEVPLVSVNKDLLPPPVTSQLTTEAPSSYLRFVTFVDDISTEEQKIREEENQVKQLEFSILKARDKELNLIKEGNLKAKKCTIQSVLDKDIAFQKYLDLFYKRPDVAYPEDDPVDEEDKFIVKVDSSYNPSEEDSGFFSVQVKKDDIQRIKDKLKKCREEDMQRRKLLQEKSDTELPMKKIRSLSIETDQVDLSVKERPTRPPLSASTTYIERLKALKTLTANNKQFAGKTSSEKIGKFFVSSDEYPLNKITKTNVNKRSVKKFNEILYKDEPDAEALPVAPDGILPNSVVVALYKELRRESIGAELKTWKPFELTDDQLAEVNNFNSKKVIKKIDSPVPSPSIDESDSWNAPDIEEKQSAILDQLVEIQESIPTFETEDLTTPPITPPDSPLPPPVTEKEPVKRKPILKLVSTARVVRALVIPAPTPPPPLPLPEFVLQFQEYDWYKRCFHDLTSETFEIPHTIGNFVKLLLQALKSMKEYSIKTGIVDAILVLLKQDEFIFNDEITELVKSEILTGISMPGGEPSSTKSDDQMQFIKTCLQLLLALTKGADPIVIAELMVQFILAPSMFRKEIMKTFEELGLQDAKEFFPTELHTFDVSLVVQSQQKNKLNELSHEWLLLWMKKLRQRITSLTGKIGRASKGHNLRRTTLVAEKPKGILKKKDSIKVNRGRSIAFVSDNFVGEAARNISPIDAINYFCEMKYEEHLEWLKSEAMKKKLNTSNKDRNTIMCLPKIEGLCSLVRLGETHKSICHPERETSLAHVLPPIQGKQGVRSLLLHVSTLKLTPFPDELDELIYAPAANSNLVTLRYSQKYFIPSSSFV